VRRLFVSDLHLTAAAPEAIEQFLRFLAREAAGAQALYVLGDLFEFWVGDDEDDALSERVCAALKGVAGAGTALYLMHGNRDFLLGEGFCGRTGGYLLPDPSLVDIDGEAVLLSHGDALCVDDRPYQQLRSIVRTPAYQRRFLALPLRARIALADRARAGSRAHTSRQVPTLMDVNPGTVLAAFRATGAARLVHGHTHRPGIHELIVDGRTVRRVVLGAWYEQGSYLECEGGHWQLRQLER